MSLIHTHTHTHTHVWKNVWAPSPGLCCRGKVGDYNTAVQQGRWPFRVYFLFYFPFFFIVQAFRQSLIQHSSISVVAYIGKHGDYSGGGNRIFFAVVESTLFKLGAVHLHDSRGSSSVRGFSGMGRSSGEMVVSSVWGKSTVAAPVQCGLWKDNRQWVLQIYTLIHAEILQC